MLMHSSYSQSSISYNTLLMSIQFDCKSSFINPGNASCIAIVGIPYCNCDNSANYLLSQSEEQEKLLKDYISYLTSNLDTEKRGQNELISILKNIHGAIESGNSDSFATLSKKYKDYINSITESEEELIKRFCRNVGLDNLNWK